ncbi:unnamed protein product [Citrullus colocynthis]|uniref:Uncharacterized protein n=1 Tax=Citrullus colocynthis TaxID=252529 RepID=A0ABP0XS50_9ROSI
MVVDEGHGVPGGSSCQSSKRTPFFRHLLLPLSSPISCQVPPFLRSPPLEFKHRSLRSMPNDGLPQSPCIFPSEFPSNSTRCRCSNPLQVKT